MRYPIFESMVNLEFCFLGRLLKCQIDWRQKILKWLGFWPKRWVVWALDMGKVFSVKVKTSLTGDQSPDLAAVVPKLCR